jgi:hypothetical protein
VATAFGRCVGQASAAIERSPAHWVYWASEHDLQTLELSAPDRALSPAGTRPGADEVLLSRGAGRQRAEPG